MPLKLEDFEVLTIIGKGSFGTCYNVRNKLTRELFAMKAVDYGNLSENNKELLVSEVNLLRSLSHPNIVRYCGKILHKETTTLYIITEWCEGGDLSRLIKSTKESGKHFEEQFIWRILYQISRAIQVCHSRMRNFTIFHRDIKPANVFLDSHGNAKLGDFGLARIVRPEKEYSETFVGTPYYMSPELIKGHKYNRKSDIWALGCLIYELCALSPPFTGCNMTDLANTIKIGKYNNIPLHYSEDMKKVISFMLSKKHEFRPTVEMILHHPTVVTNVVPHRRERTSSRQSQHSSSNDNDSYTVNCSVDSEMVNLTLAEPELVSNKVFNDKWIEKHEALKEKEAWLKKREKSIGDKERSLASREKQLLLMERQARQKRLLLELQQKSKKKEVSRLEPTRSGHETEVSIEPGDTPVRPTSTKLDPLRLPRPDILINACKKLEQFNRKAPVKQVSFEQPVVDKCVMNKFGEPSKVRRSLILTGNVKNNVLSDKNNLHGSVLNPMQQTGQHSKNLIRDENDKQKTDRESLVRILKKEVNHKGKRDKENMVLVNRIDNLKRFKIPQGPISDSLVLHTIL